MKTTQALIRSLIVLSILCPATLFAQAKKQGAVPGKAAMAASIERGKQVFSVTCLPCHQADGAGVPQLNPPLIKTKYVLGPKPTLIGIVLKGLTGEIEVNGDTYNNTMPPRTELSDMEVADVLTYVRNSFGNKASAVSPAEVKAIRAKIK